MSNLAKTRIYGGGLILNEITNYLLKAKFIQNKQRFYQELTLFIYNTTNKMFSI